MAAAPSPDRIDLSAAVPELGGSVRVTGAHGPIDVWRDPQGIPHVRAGSVHDAFFGQGWVHAQDRLWQMEYDRRRAAGRWAELAGPDEQAGDIQMRRFRLADSARADVAAGSPDTRAMLEAYAAGVNAWIASTARLPLEYGLCGARPDPWRPEDSHLVFKVRHILMGVWQVKAWRARLVRHLGATRAAQICPGAQPHPMLIVPPGVEYDGPATDALAALSEGEAALPALPEWEVGSNNWALHGSRTASGKPLVAGDPHRPLDVPSVYYQNHLACPEFDAIGLSFAGVPGLPHFGHNARVAWCVTHLQADYQDLFIERFDPGEPRRVAVPGGWGAADVRRETVAARGGASVEIESWATAHGAIVLGDPRQGHAIAFRYTATAEPNATFDAILPMLRARTALELEEAQRSWVDPGNNLVFADVDGHIGYRARGTLPQRSPLNGWLPVPGWDGAHDWRGAVPFEEMPAMRDPREGFVATANSRVAGPDYKHYITVDQTPDFRTRRVVDRLAGLERATAADMAAIHADRLSLPGRDFAAILGALPPLGGPVEAARRLVAGWDGRVDAESCAATVYAVLRERLMRDLLMPILGPLSAEAFAGTPRGAVGHMARLRALLADMIQRDDRTLLPPGTDWPAALARALAGAVEELTARLGADMAAWQWRRIHGTEPRHPLSRAFPALAAQLDPPRAAMGGDGDTVQAASFIASAGYGLTSTSVARYVFDLGDWERSAWIVPLGASGHPGSSHYADQVEAWAACRLYPMRYDWKGIQAGAETHQRLEPA